MQNSSRYKKTFSISSKYRNIDSIHPYHETDGGHFDVPTRNGCRLSSCTASVRSADGEAQSNFGRVTNKFVAMATS